MRESLPRKVPGDSLEASHVDRLSELAERAARSKSGSWLHGRHTSSVVSVSGLPPFKQFPAIVTANQIDANDATDSGFYLIALRYWDADSETWKTDSETQWELDVSDRDLMLTISEKLTVFWSPQRQMFLPVAAPSGAIKLCKATSNVATGATATLNVVDEDKTTVIGEQEATNETGEVMLASILLKAFQPFGWTKYVMEPYEIEPCET